MVEWHRFEGRMVGECRIVDYTVGVGSRVVEGDLGYGCEVGDGRVDAGADDVAGVAVAVAAVVELVADMSGRADD